MALDPRYPRDLTERIEMALADGMPLDTIVMAVRRALALHWFSELGEAKEARDLLRQVIRGLARHRPLTDPEAGPRQARAVLALAVQQGCPRAVAETIGAAHGL